MTGMISVSVDLLIEGIKELYTLAQNKKCESVVEKLDELVKQASEVQYKTIEMQKQLYQLQQENQQLKDEVARLEDLWKQEQDVEEHPTQPFITFKNDPKQIKYCANCWHEQKIKTRFCENRLLGTLDCPRCQTVVCGEETGIELKPIPYICGRPYKKSPWERHR